MIEGVVIKELTTHNDERGFFRELIRTTDDFFAEGFGQWSHSLMLQDVIKAWHSHNKQTDWWYVAGGVLRTGLCDLRDGSSTCKQTMDLLMGDGQQPQIIKIPPGVAHGCRAVRGPANLFYVTSGVYDPNDEIRIPHDSPEIDFDWLKDPDL